MILSACTSGTEDAPPPAPPHDTDAEAAVLSAALHEPQKTLQMLQALRPHHFYADANAQVWQSVLRLQEKTDVVTVLHDLRERGCDKSVGGAPYLALLANATPSVANVQAHAEIVREMWKRRTIIEAALTVVASLRGGGINSQQAWDAFRASVQKRKLT